MGARMSVGVPGISTASRVSKSLPPQGRPYLVTIAAKWGEGIPGSPDPLPGDMGLRWESWTDTGPEGRPPCTASSGGGSRQEPSPSSTMAMPTPSPSSGARRESRREHGGTSAKGPGEGDGGAWLSQESREALRVSAPERRGRWVRSGSREGGGPPAGRARTVIGPGARTATLVAPLRSDRLS